MLFIVLSGLSCGSGTGEGDKVGYVRLNTLFRQFQMKKELASRLGRTNSKEDLLDSVRSRTVGKKGNGSPLQHLRKQQRRGRKRAQRRASELSATVWDRLEQYIREYGRQHDYSFIHGMRGKGALLYGQEGADITEEVLEYANARYNGKKGSK